MRPIAELSRIDALAPPTGWTMPKGGAGADRHASRTGCGLGRAWRPLRQQDKFGQAVPAYDKALSLIDPRPMTCAGSRFTRGHRAGAFGPVHQGRGRFPRRPGRSAPDSAQVLNYLGYSLVDRNEKLDEALKLIQRAVELRPDDGYILPIRWPGPISGWAATIRRSPRWSAPSPPWPAIRWSTTIWATSTGWSAQARGRHPVEPRPVAETPDRGRGHRIRVKLDRGLDAVLAEERPMAASCRRLRRPRNRRRTARATDPMILPRREVAPAKLNLTLHVTGRRADGYHLLDSLVVFCDLGDVVTLAEGPLALTVTGPLRGPAAEPDNLLPARRAAGRASGLDRAGKEPAGRLGHRRRLGRCGGGFARPGCASPAGTEALGADVPVCMMGPPDRMRGLGEILDPLPALPALHLCWSIPVGAFDPSVFRH